MTPPLVYVCMAAADGGRVPPLALLAYQCVKREEESAVAELKSDAAAAAEAASHAVHARAERLIEEIRQHADSDAADARAAVMTDRNTAVRAVRGGVAANVAPVMDTIATKQASGWCECVGPLEDAAAVEELKAADELEVDEGRREILRMVRGQGDGSEIARAFERLSPASAGTCKALFRDPGRRISRSLVPMSVQTLRGSPHTTEHLIACVCDARADLCPACRPERRPCGLCGEQFCSFCFAAHKPVCDRRFMDVCGADLERRCLSTRGPSGLRGCAQRARSSQQCGEVDEWQFGVDGRLESERRDRCSVQSCNACSGECRGIWAWDGDECEDSKCTARLCPAHADAGLCPPCEARKRAGRIPFQRKDTTRLDATRWVCWLPELPDGQRYRSWAEQVAAGCGREQCGRCTANRLQALLAETEAAAEAEGLEYAECQRRVLEAERHFDAQLPPGHPNKRRVQRPRHDYY